MNRSFAVLVITERLQRQWKKERLFFGKHCRDLPLRCAMNARVGPARLPLIQIGLSLFEAFEAFPLQWSLLCVSNAALDFAFVQSRQLHVIQPIPNRFE